MDYRTLQADYITIQVDYITLTWIMSLAMVKQEST